VPIEPLSLACGAHVEPPVALVRGDRRMLYLLGGSGPARRPESIVRVDLFSAAESEVPLRGDVPDEIVTAAVSPVATRALVLDRTRRRFFAEYRLLDVDLSTGQATTLAAFPAFGLFSDHQLTSVPDGTFILTASGRHGRHVIVRLRVEEARVRVVGADHRSGAVVGPIVATDRGVTLPVARGAQPWTLRGVPYTRLRHGGDRHLRGCF
jgi:hypothetical protein